MTHRSHQRAPVSRAYLPPAVRRRLDNAFPGFDLPTSIRIEQEGCMETRHVRVPAAAVVTFEREDGPWTYFRGVTAIEFACT
jgi:hypothetical protein